MNSRLKWMILMSMGLMLLNACAHKSGRTNNMERSRSERRVGSPRIESKEEKEPTSAPEPSNSRGDGHKMEGSEVFEKYNTAVFMIHTTNGVSQMQGSGFFIDGHGLAVSNYHVFQGTYKGEESIKLGDEYYKVSEVIHSSADEDFILFRVQISGNNYIPIARTKPQVGVKVFALGSPRGLENTFSSGEVSQWRDDNVMQISALIDHGSSGGALINEYGEVVGITSGTFADGSQANLNYAWSIDVVKPYLP